MLHVFLSVSIIFLVIYGIEGFGVVPEEILARVNASIKIHCSVDTANGELNFYDGDDLVPAAHINRVNDTYIELTNVYSKPVKKNFTCKQDKNSVGLSEVFVDERMAPVENFRCHTQDLINLECSFKKPPSILPISYRFTFAINGGLVHQSKLKPDLQGGYSTVINVTEPRKSFNEMSFAFVLFERNKFYRMEEKFEMKLMEVLTPNPIDDAKVMDDLTTESSAFISFKLPKELEKVAKHMIFDVRLRLADKTLEDKLLEWRRIENPRLQLKESDGFLIFDNLDYANTAYEVKIRMKSKIAIDNNELWSDYKEVAFNTRPKRPETLPQTCINCFNVMDNGKIVVYWMEVPKLYQNADKFSYLVRVQNEDEKEILRRRQRETSMVLLKNSSSVNLKVQVFSDNSVGTSEGFSQLFIPTQKLLNRDLKIRKEIIDGDYEISWKLQQRIDVESYTIIWCHQRNELLNQCDDSIRFHNIPADTTHFRTKATSLLQFGVAANYRDSSIVPGFKWAECTAAKPNQIGQVRSMWTKANSQRSITINWKLNCVDEPIVVGYNITYCMLDHKRLDKCEEQAVSKIVILNEDEEIFQYDIVELKTYRLYNISIALMSQNRLGVHKSPITARTLEGAPTPPRDVRATKIDSSSIEITWSRPYEVNGESLTYQLWYNDRKVDINDNYTLNTSFFYLIENLESFTNYTITVVACTSECSESSDSLTLRTAIGLPGTIFQPTMEKLDKDRTKISWTAPIVAGGNLNYFDLKLSRLNDRGLFEEKVFRLNGQLRHCFIKSFNCDSGNINFFVRAVNVDKKISSSSYLSDICFEHKLLPDIDTTDQYIGEWSQPLIFYCTIGQSLATIGLIFILATSSMILTYIFIKIYQKYLRMKDIQTEWPTGLDPFTSLDPKESYGGVKDLDLVKDHVLTDIEEEEEIIEREKFLPEKRIEVASPIVKQIDVKQRGNSRSESFLQPQSNEIFHPLPKMQSSQKKVQSAPVTPEKHVAQSEFAQDSYVDVNTGYMKMNPPPRFRTESSPSIDGYLDMTGSKSLSPSKFMPLEIIESPPKIFIEQLQETKKAVKTDYVTNDIKNFIKDSEINNNGYIGKRASMITDPLIKRPTIIDSNGYVGLQLK